MSATLISLIIRLIAGAVNSSGTRANTRPALRYTDAYAMLANAVETLRRSCR